MRIVVIFVVEQLVALFDFFHKGFCVQHRPLSLLFQHMIEQALNSRNKIPFFRAVRLKVEYKLAEGMNVKKQLYRRVGVANVRIVVETQKFLIIRE